MLASMSSQNLIALERIYSAWGDGEFQLDSLLPEDFTLVIGPDVPDTGTYAGHERVAGYMAQFLEPWERLTIAPEEMIEQGDRVLVRVLQSGAGRSSGIATELRLFNLWTFENGAPVQMEAFKDESLSKAEFDS
jgi:ketosteroid isomerase-like protein